MRYFGTWTKLPDFKQLLKTFQPLILSGYYDDDDDLRCDGGPGRWIGRRMRTGDALLSWTDGGDWIKGRRNPGLWAGDEPGILENRGRTARKPGSGRWRAGAAAPELFQRGPTRAFFEGPSHGNPYGSLTLTFGAKKRTACSGIFMKIFGHH